MVRALQRPCGKNAAHGRPAEVEFLAYGADEGRYSSGYQAKGAISEPDASQHHPSISLCGRLNFVGNLSGKVHMVSNWVDSGIWPDTGPRSI